MDDLEQTISGALAAALSGVQVHFDPYPGFGKLHPTVIWNGFQGRLQMERQRQIWDILRPILTEEQRFATGFILMVTSAEINAMQEVAA